MNTSSTAIPENSWRFCPYYLLRSSKSQILHYGPTRTFHFWIVCVCPCARSHSCMCVCCRLCETVVPLEDPIITETTSTLQEWGVLWKQLYVVSCTSPHNRTLSNKCESGFNITEISKGVGRKTAFVKRNCIHLVVSFVSSWGGLMDEASRVAFFFSAPNSGAVNSLRNCPNMQWHLLQIFFTHGMSFWISGYIFIHYLCGDRDGGRVQIMACRPVKCNFMLCHSAIDWSWPASHSFCIILWSATFSQPSLASQ